VSVIFFGLALNTTTAWQSCNFTANHARAIDGTGTGGAIYQSHNANAATAVLLLVRDCWFVGNSASAAGGALGVEQRFPNPAANLEMIVGPFTPAYYPFRICSGNTSDGTAREWDYGLGGVQIEDSTFSQNRAGTEVMEAAGGSNSGGGFGGALYATNLKITATSTTFVANWAGSSGGAAFLAAGSARLSLLGTTVLAGNTAVETGSAIYSGAVGRSRSWIAR
jgi:predicted outer membrane repeat protein